MLFRCGCRSGRAVLAHLLKCVLSAQNCCDARCAGLTTLDAGPVTVALHLNSLGHNELILAGLEERHSYSDFEAYLEESPTPSPNGPVGSPRSSVWN
jgi:hypothetical protein